MKRMTALILILALLGAGLYGCASQSAAPSETGSGSQAADGAEASDSEAGADSGELEVIRVASLSRELAVPFYYMHEMGYDVENGFEIELSAYDSGALVNEAQAAGLWDVTAIGAAGVQSMVKYDCVHLYPHQDSAAGIEMLVRPDSDILSVKGYNPDYPDLYGSPETLKGKTILVAIGSGNHMLTSLWLNALGLKDEDVNLVHMEYAQGWQAFKNGEGDIYSSAFPWSITAADEGYVVAADFGSLGAQYTNNIFATREYYSSHPDTLVKMIQQLARSCSELRDADLVTEYALEWYHLNGNMISEEEARQQMTSQPFWGLETVGAEGFDSTASIKLQVEFMQAIGSITDEEAENVLNNSFKTDILQEALESMPEY